MFGGLANQREQVEEWEELRLKIAERCAQYEAQMKTVESCVLGWVLVEMTALREELGR